MDYDYNAYPNDNIETHWVLDGSDVNEGDGSKLIAIFVIIIVLLLVITGVIAYLLIIRKKR